MAQIYLKSNILLQNPLTLTDIKPRLLGHWGTCPGINFVYALMNNLICETSRSTIFVLGPGHGYPALQANLYMEGTLGEYYEDAQISDSGLEYIIKNFSWPYGFPSHTSPMTPGAILEGGELGYSLAVSYGAVLDNPDLLTICLIGDGEAETGPLSASWQLNKIISTNGNGSVLPILHLNGHKISGSTMFGRMTHSEIRSYFSGLGYEPLFIEDIPGEDIFRTGIEIFEKAYSLILKNEEAERSGTNSHSPRPVIILKTSKGWTGPQFWNNEKIEGTFRSHQVPLKDCNTEMNQLTELEKWLKSYKFEELFDLKNGFCEDIKSIIPKGDLRAGMNPVVNSKKNMNQLELPNPAFSCEALNATNKNEELSSSLRRIGHYFDSIFYLNKSRNNFRLFSPDETYSNKLDEVFNTVKKLAVRIDPDDIDTTTDGSTGRVIEILSEHVLFGLLIGYTLTGRTGVFASYEAFVQIVSSMCDQYEKFIRVARDIQWRGEVPSINIILTSSGWRQDHNGFSHQNPGFIGNLLEQNDDKIRIYFPPDGNTSVYAMHKMLSQNSGINVLVAGKTAEPRLLSPEEAKVAVDNGIMIWEFISDPDPDIILVGIGDYVTKEVLEAIKLIRRNLPEAKVRFVNVIDLKKLQIPELDELFTIDKPVLINFHGHPESVKKILYGKKDQERIEIRGYIENGSTTTPFDMHIRNRTSRWHILLWSIEKLYASGRITKEIRDNLADQYMHEFSKHKKYIMQYGVDPIDLD